MSTPRPHADRPGYVIKYGGNAMTDLDTRRAVALAIRDLAEEGTPPVVVHGGGPFIKAALDDAGLEHRFSRGLRVTSAASMVVIESVLATLGKRLAMEIGPAVGLSGRDAGLLLAEQAEAELGRVGHMRTVNVAVLRALRSARLVPVVGCVAIDEHGEALNVNADEVAGAVAAALGEGAYFLSDVPGVLDDPARSDSPLAVLSRSQAEARIANGRIAGGMIPKVESALAALARGAPFAVIADGRSPQSVRAALAGSGTRLIPG
ncbi:MAG TPA: acetylglutamate kinase [Trueperaceae bacterium]|nr:acetylglutamate kinase [Trueperaceae bacterium]